MQQRITLLIAEITKLNNILGAYFLCVTNGDSIQPRAETPARIVGMQIAIRCDQRILQHVFRVCETCAASEQESQQADTIMLYEVRECIRGPRFCGINQLQLVSH